MTSQSKKHFIYILRCVDGTLYTGYTTNLDKRIVEHNGGGNTKAERSAGAKYTRPRRPVELVHSEEFASRSEAMQREYAIKQLTKTQKEVLLAKG
ncbi:GIY-YIG nuclease family protein [Candidatus Nomurabacteria bacterium]|nr:GIY-YIG nuclease family protein [Candidatus Kaiserbacteria bacterium]MCB9814634.1 GIY-YIG nuclease family protein [Candidatus Nomurabacteria bacterium]